MSEPLHDSAKIWQTLFHAMYDNNAHLPKLKHIKYNVAEYKMKLLVMVVMR